MKIIIQLSLVCIIIFFLYIFNVHYFKKNELTNVQKNISNTELPLKSENNLIKNLKYEVNLINDDKYTIFAELSEIMDLNSNQLIKMYGVKSTITNKKREPLEITSDSAEYNRGTFNTKFRDNVNIKYDDNEILSDKLDFDFEKKKIIIYDNVRYSGNQSKLLTDNIEINLITKEIQIYMNNEYDNVIFNTNNLKYK